MTLVFAIIIPLLAIPRFVNIRCVFVLVLLAACCSFVVVGEVRWVFGLTPLAALKKSWESFFCESC